MSDLSKKNMRIGLYENNIESLMNEICILKREVDNKNRTEVKVKEDISKEQTGLILDKQKMIDQKNEIERQKILISKLETDIVGLQFKQEIINGYAEISDGEIIILDSQQNYLEIKQLNQKLLKENEELKEEIIQKSYDITCLKDQVKNVTKSLQEYQDKLNSAEDLSKHQKNVIESRNREFAEAKLQIESKNRELADTNLQTESIGKEHQDKRVRRDCKTNAENQMQIHFQKAQIQMLLGENKRLKEEMKLLSETKQQQLTEALDQVESLRTKFQEKVERSEEDVKEFEEQRIMYQEQVKMFEGQLESLREELKNQTIAKETDEATIIVTEENNQKIRSEHVSTISSFNNLAWNKLKLFEEEKIRLEQKISRLEEKNLMMKQKNDEKNEIIGDQQSKITSQSARLESLRKVIENHNQDNSRTNLELFQHTQNMEEKELEILSNSLELCETKTSRLEECRNQLQQKNAEKNKIIASQRVKIYSQKTELDSLRTENQSIVIENSKLKQQIAEKESEVDNLIDALRICDCQLRSLRKENKIKDETIENLKQEIVGRNQRVEDNKNQILKLSNTIKQNEKELKDSKVTTDKIIVKKTKLIESLNAAVDSLIVKGGQQSELLIDKSSILESQTNQIEHLLDLVATRNCELYTSNEKVIETNCQIETLMEKQNQAETEQTDLLFALQNYLC